MQLQMFWFGSAVGVLLQQWQGPQCDLPVMRPGVVNEFG
jgi:hypothetical protein